VVQRKWLPLGVWILGFLAFGCYSRVFVSISTTVSVEQTLGIARDCATDLVTTRALISHGFQTLDQARPKFRRLDKPEFMEKACTGNLNSIHWIYRLSERFVAHGLVFSEATATFLVFEILQRINKWARQLLRFYGAGLLPSTICDWSFLALEVVYVQNDKNFGKNDNFKRYHNVTRGLLKLNL